MTTQASPLNFAKLEENPDFRAEELYFIRMTNAYVAGIFWDAFPRNNKNRRRSLYELVKVLPDKHRHLRDAILPIEDQSGKRGQAVLDCLGGGFVKDILQKLDEPTAKHFEEIAMKFNHGLLIRFSDDLNRAENLTFLKAIEVLYKRRNFLEHYGEPNKVKANGNLESGRTSTEKYLEKQSKNNWDHSDHNVIRALSLFLLPEIMHHFAGRIAHYENKLLPQSNVSNAAIVREIIRAAVKERKEHKKLLFDAERKRSKMKDKAKRKAILSDDIPWRAAYLKHSEHKGRATDYRQHEFKLRYYFIGQRNIDAIMAKLARNGEVTHFHFKRDIEAFYVLTIKVNMQIHLALGCVPRDAQKNLIGDDADETVFLSDIRNGIAHNGLFWNIKRDDQCYASREIFDLVFRKLDQHQGREAANQFYNRVAALLNDQNYSIVDIDADTSTNTPPKALHIKHWKKAHREKYSSGNRDGVSVDHRRVFRARVAHFYRHLKAARNDALLAKPRKTATEGVA
jgi:hypothetical protein